MVTKNLTYTDFNGVERTETFYFNLTAAEVAAWQNSMDGGMAAYVQQITAANSTPELTKLFQELIDRSYGRKSLDGRKFEKSPEILADFKATQAYSDLYMELATDAQKASEFMNGLAPKIRSAEGAAAAVPAPNAVLMPAT